ncbi:30S ribosomal protein S17, chloroplastic [Capsicum annuum]|uniref:Small ribosomal subunit protein uS17c n=1 Tax=Capsicum annuum TaxID=4072 RepID=A0A1U8G3X8_CAPAN|nr:30S ribosomal protein S17, chloroplastic [Capsicum annuum]KAF3649659.1 30S ribosomal protein S17, chloroplastic [Capsicum annuum]KAF3663301.1 30S ribosomal protein S17, chloroplastic [Capsicum annuum]PHT88808.1 30S ribosomal protein S17, chloroplastic [Capsicum annuum]
MSLTSPLLQLPLSQFKKSLTISSPFLHGSSPLSHLSKPSSSITSPNSSPPSFLPPVRAMRSMQGKVVCSANDKTVSVEVTRLAPHPKYKRRVRKKKKYQAHDPLNQFQVGDFVQLEKSKPISKTKAFIAVPVPPRNQPKVKEDENKELGLPLQSSLQES